MRKVLEYVWLDAWGNLRSKTKVITAISDETAIPKWNYDGSSTGQASTDNSEIELIPVKIYLDPFRPNGKIVLCNTSDNLSTMTLAQEIFKKSDLDKPLFGLEQEFYVCDENMQPIGNKTNTNSYCNIGATITIRNFMEEVLFLALEMDLPLTGMNMEVGLSQGEFQVCDYGINASHALTMLRYLLHQTAEKYAYIITFEPKPFGISEPGSGCHINFSTENTRNIGGLLVINTMLENLANSHQEDMQIYGKGNADRLTGKHETADYVNFSVGIGNRGASVRIPTETASMDKGYFEDRRPGANIDPYLATANLYQVAIEGNSLVNDEKVQKYLLRQG